ncbi:cardiolipin synthase [Brevibacillus formosus]|uniref:cardiolipin synthase n=1 Tax=Brevibacillus TaxID=55080 RepID=UPI000D0F26D7|nr:MULTISPECIES: cardiolipin synthase [Brevibacillus]MBG9942086.1 phospholipase D [Brevibacillus formosus]MED1944899.1 cardiolipin synthase [Brevibacillus formosus]MED1996414.1 cardiolipin synthase [Brevibacillus formosus]MED2081383.1 cardiolipin synthase [Brevibacillus formosus]PSK19785.1 cardiolipin synthase [Brevibacillus sp. NRRL NRS-603]
MALSEKIFAIITIGNLILAAVLIFMERRNIAATWAWLMVLLFLPGIGFIIYLIFGHKLSKKKLYRLKEGEFSHFRAAVDRQKQLLAHGELQVNDPEMERHRDMIFMNVVSDGAYYTQDNTIQVFKEGHSLFKLMFKQMEEAREHIHLLYYILNDDDLGKQLIQLLTKKAQEGVEVRLLYDAVGSSGVSSSFLRPLVDAGGEVASFFPAKIPFLNFRVNFRNHRKLTIIDGKIGYIGGFNIGDEYLGKDKKLGYWRDTHLLIEGRAVYMLQARFFLDWNLSAPKRMNESLAYFPELHEAEGTIGVQIVSSGPNSEKEQIKHAFLKMIYKARKKIYLQTPYFVPDESMLTALKMAAMSGVDVRVMVPGRPDHLLVFWATHSYLGDLLKSGVRCFLYEKGFMHAKAIVVDTQLSSVGTANVDIRSFKLNFETNAFLYDSQMAKELEELFVSDLADCREMTLGEYVNRPLRLRLLESLARLLSPLL